MLNKKFKKLDVIAIIVSILYIIPIYILINMSLKSPRDLSSKWVMPNYLYLKNFYSAWEQASMARSMLNNCIITMSTVFLVVIIGSFAAYPLARIRTRLNNIMYTLFISCMIVPPLTVLVPLYKFIVNINGMNTYWAIVLMLLTFQLPLCIFLYTNFITTIPKELDEAAIIDGCGKFSVFFRVIMPLLKSVTASVIILSGVSVWNDYQFSVFFLQKTEMRTISVSLSQFVSQYQNDIGLVSTGCLIGIIPITITYLFLQKYFIAGMTDGAIKG